MSDQVKEIYGVGSVSIDEYAYYHSLSKEDQAGLRNIRVIDASPEYDGSAYRPDGSEALRWGVPVKPDFMPKHLQKNGPKRQVEDFVKGWGMALVSETFRQVVEKLEPDVHQFFPVDMVWEDGDPVDGQYYWFVVCNALDTVNREHTDAPPRKYGFKFLQQREGYGLWKTHKDDGGHYQIVYDLKSVNGYHIWRDKFLNGGPFCSGQFKQACEEVGIVGIGFGREKLRAV